MLLAENLTVKATWLLLSCFEAATRSLKRGLGAFSAVNALSRLSLGKASEISAAQ